MGLIISALDSGARKVMALATPHRRSNDENEPGRL